MERRINFARARGNVIVMIVAVTTALLIPVILFCLWYMRTMGSHQEQTTAIQAAALAASRSLSRVTIDDPNFGLVSLSDYAPAASNTAAKDGLAMPVRGINSLLATVRIDMIVADQMNDPTMKQLARLDYTNAMDTVAFMNTQLKAAIAPTGQDFRDIDGNPITPYKDAMDAYESNVIRMTGVPNSLNKSTFKLILGALNAPGSTNTPIPQPAVYANVSASGTTTAADGTAVSTYKSYLNEPYNGQDFVFAATDSQVRLVDNASFTIAPAGLPYFVPSVLQVSADQLFRDAQRGEHNIHTVACAQAASTYDPRPAPGALKISFLNGAIPEIVKPGDILTSPKLSPPANLNMPTSGDFPATALGPIVGTIPILGGTPPLANVGSTGFYDWYKRAGAKANVKAIVDMKNSSLSSLPSAHSDVYTFDQNGSITHKVLNFSSMLNVPVPGSNMQLYAESTKPVVSSNGTSYNVVASDPCFNPGRLVGGIHGGEPIIDPSLGIVPALQSVIITQNPAEKRDWLYGYGSLGFVSFLFGAFSRKKLVSFLAVAVLLMQGTLLVDACTTTVIAPPAQVLTTSVTGPRNPRPTYTTDGMAFEISFKKI